MGAYDTWKLAEYDARDDEGLLRARCACGQEFLVRIDDDDRTQCPACAKHDDLVRRLAKRAEHREQEKAS